MKSIEQRLQELEDDSAIRALASKFADAAMTAACKEFNALWSANGKWTIHELFFTSAEGIDKINEMLVTLRTGRSFFVQLVVEYVIDGVVTQNKGYQTSYSSEKFKLKSKA